MSFTSVHKHTFHVPTDRFNQTTENVMSSVCADRAVIFPNFKRLPFRTHQVLFRVLYAVTFRMRFSICVLKHTLHILTEPSSKQNEYTITSLFFCPHYHKNFPHLQILDTCCCYLLTKFHDGTNTDNELINKSETGYERA